MNDTSSGKHFFLISWEVYYCIVHMFLLPQVSQHTNSRGPLLDSRHNNKGMNHRRGSSRSLWISHGRPSRPSSRPGTRVSRPSSRRGTRVSRPSSRRGIRASITQTAATWDIHSSNHNKLLVNYTYY